MVEWPDQPAPAFVLYWLFRKDQLCPGEGVCDRSIDGIQRCTECWLTKLEDEMAGPTGTFLARVLDYDYAGRNGFSLSLSLITSREFAMLRRLESERQKYELEERRHQKQDTTLQAMRNAGNSPHH